MTMGLVKNLRKGDEYELRAQWDLQWMSSI